MANPKNLANHASYSCIGYGHLKGVALRIILPASPTHVREQSGKKFQPSKVIEYLTNYFNEKLSTVHVSVAIIDVKIKQAVSRRPKALKERLWAYLALEPLEIGNR